MKPSLAVEPYFPENDNIPEETYETDEPYVPEETFHTPNVIVHEENLENDELYVLKENFERSGILSVDQKKNFLDVAENYLLEVQETFDEIYGIKEQEKLNILEVCCPPDSRLSKTFMESGCSAMRIGLPAFDIKTHRGLEESLHIIDQQQPELTWFSLPCGPYSPIQKLFNENTPEKMVKSENRKKISRKMIRNGIVMAKRQLSQGRHFAWEWPVNNGGWKLREMREFVEMLQKWDCLHLVPFDGCAYGLKSSKGNFLRKPWKVITSSALLAAALQRKCPGHAFHDECLGHDEARSSGFYPQSLCDTILRATREIRPLSSEEAMFPVFDTSGTMEEKIPDYAPLNESEKKASMKLIDKLHRRTGHPSNPALVATLRHRGAHPEVLQLAQRHVCPDCQELRLAPLHPAVALERSEVLWEVLVLDNAEFHIDDKVIHAMIMVDEASRLIVPHFLFEHLYGESRNCTGEEAIHAIEESWIRHYGMPASIRLDPEGAFRSGVMGQWSSERGIEILPCAAEAHGQIGLAERAIQTIKNTVRQLVQGSEFSGWLAIIQACRAHNELEKVEGFSPYQWAFGRQPTMSGRMHPSDHDVPYWTSSAAPGSNMAINLKLRVQAQQIFLRKQAEEHVTRAANSKTRKSLIFNPGDLVYFKRVKPPAQPQAAARMHHKIWRWYGPGRVLASETRSDSKGLRRKPAHIIWVVSHGRLKRCAPDQLRHASERERLLAENSESTSCAWTFHSLAQTLYKGEFEILDTHVFPEDEEAKGPPRHQGRSRSLSRPAERQPRTPRVGRSQSVAADRTSEPPEKIRKKTSQDVKTGISGEEAHQKAELERRTLQKSLSEISSGERAHQEAGIKNEKKEKKEKKDKKEKKEKDEKQERPHEAPSSSSSSSIISHPNVSEASNSVPTSGVRYEAVDLGRYLNDPSFSPPPHAMSRDRPTAELFQQPLFKKARRELGDGEADAVMFGVPEGEDFPNDVMCTIDIELPDRLSTWKQFKRTPEAFFVKKIKNAEVKWHALDPKQKEEFQKAKMTEVSQWLAASAVKRVTGEIRKDRIIPMRWVLTYKENGSAKGRIVLIGYKDPDLEELQSSAPTMCRRTRQTGPSILIGEEMANFES